MTSFSVNCLDNVCVFVGVCRSVLHTFSVSSKYVDVSSQKQLLTQYVCEKQKALSGLYNYRITEPLNYFTHMR